jgi:hypothetical protein
MLVDDAERAFQPHRRFDPRPRHLQENVALLIGPGGARPADALLTQLFRRRHDKPR